MIKQSSRQTHQENWSQAARTTDSESLQLELTLTKRRLRKLGQKSWTQRETDRRRNLRSVEEGTVCPHARVVSRVGSKRKQTQEAHLQIRTNQPHGGRMASKSQRTKGSWDAPTSSERNDERPHGTVRGGRDAGRRRKHGPGHETGPDQQLALATVTKEESLAREERASRSGTRAADPAQQHRGPLAETQRTNNEKYPTEGHPIDRGKTMLMKTRREEAPSLRTRKQGSAQASCAVRGTGI